ncbi:MAG: hypothetical protein ABJB85_12125 [Nitrososphaerota archaeon]
MLIPSVILTLPEDDTLTEIESWKGFAECLPPNLGVIILNCYKDFASYIPETGLTKDERRELKFSDGLLLKLPI